jgi:anaerobic magnesium-protoporphyrin IX monomethyl ester cyclase
MNKKNTIDCLFIGHNQIDFETYEQSVREMGVNSGAYRDVNKNFLSYNGKNYNASDVFNLFCNHEDSSYNSNEPVRMGESFNNGIGYLGTYLHRRGFTFDYINTFQDKKEKLAEKFGKNNILTIAILTTFYVSVLPILEILEFIRNHNKSAKIIIGGPFVATKARTLEPAGLLYLLRSMGADVYVNSSQGEATLVQLLKAFKQDHNPELTPIPNIYIKNNDDYVSTPIQMEDNNLCENMVNWSLFPDAGNYVNIRTGISCPFSCSFCGFPEHAGKYQTAKVEAVEKELTSLENLGTVQSIHFVDDTFNVPPERFKQILRMMIKNKYSFKWNAFFRCQYADREMVELMKESGCESAFLGLESGNDQILKNMNKSVNVEKYLKGIELLKEYSITTLGNFIIGFPGETDQTVKETKQFIRECGIDFYRAQLWYCEPITPIYRQKEKFGIKGEHFEWSHNTMDSRTASVYVDNIIKSLEQPTLYPQYYFDYDNLVQLLHKGLNLEQVHQYLRSFANGIKEKLHHPERKEVSYEVIRQIRNSCLKQGAIGETTEKEEDTPVVQESMAEFDF